MIGRVLFPPIHPDVSERERALYQGLEGPLSVLFGAVIVGVGALALGVLGVV